jgi:hypothetical protein
MSNIDKKRLKSVPSVGNKNKLAEDSKHIDEQDKKEDMFGIDPLTKDMNVVEYYTHLLQRFSSDRTKIREYLLTLDAGYQCGFLSTPFIEKSFSSMDNKEQLEFCKKLEQLSSSWKSSGIVQSNQKANEFMQDTKIRESYTHSIQTLKYLEQYGARFWQKWAKEMRGAVLFINPETEEISVLSYKLPRGAEVITGMVSKMEIETQDVKPGKVKILDPEQQDTCIRLCDGDDIDIHLTAKGDGSLLVINTFTGRSMEIMRPVVEIFGTSYTQTWAQQSLELTSNQMLIVPASQGTVLEAGYMASYMVTAMLIGSEIVSRDELTQYSQSNYTYEDCWIKYGKLWIEKFLGFQFLNPMHCESQTFCFEAICKDRCGLFDDRPHNELACSYNRDRLIFLGTSLSCQRFYIPHTVYSEKFCKTIPFEEPLWWRITNARQIDAILEDMGLMILGRMTKKEFLQQYPPSNPGFDPNDDQMIENAIIDFEGFVAMKLAAFDPDPLHREICTRLNISSRIYSKLKTEAYYRSHKFNAKNIAYLAELAKTAGDIFPLARKIAGICRSGVIAERMERIGHLTMELLDFKNPDNKIMSSLHQAYDNMVIEVKEEIAKGNQVKMPKDPLVGFEKRPFDVQCKMALNFRGFDFGALLLPMYLEAFSELDSNNPDLKSIASGITMTLQPWVSGYEDRVRLLDPTSVSIQGLIVACVGTTLA